jgi:hypothetical protein
MTVGIVNHDSSVASRQKGVTFTLNQEEIGADPCQELPECPQFNCDEKKNSPRTRGIKPSVPTKITPKIDIREP